MYHNLFIGGFVGLFLGYSFFNAVSDIAKVLNSSVVDKTIGTSNDVSPIELRLNDQKIDDSLKKLTDEVRDQIERLAINNRNEITMMQETIERIKGNSRNHLRSENVIDGYI